MHRESSFNEDGGNGDCSFNESGTNCKRSFNEGVVNDESSFTDDSVNNGGSFNENSANEELHYCEVNLIEEGGGMMNKENTFEIISDVPAKASELLSLIILNQGIIECETSHISQSEEYSTLVKTEEIMQVDCAGKAANVDMESNVIAIPLDNNGEISTLPHTMVGLFNDNIESGQDVTAIEFHAADTAWISLLDKFEYVMNEDRIRGYIDGEKEFLCLWEQFQSSTMSTFCVRSSDRFYREADNTDESAVRGRILKGSPRWSRLPGVPFDGVPFVMIDRKYFGCRLGGTERHNKKKGTYKTSRNGQSVKVGCTADAEVLEVWRVPSLSLSEEMKSRERRREKKKLLGEVYKYISMDRYSRRYYVTLPLITKHINHPILNTDAGKFKVLHPLVIEKIYELVNQGIYDKKVIRYMLSEFVGEYQKQLSIDIKLSDRSFYPTDRDIGNHIRNAKYALENTKITVEVVDESDAQDIHEVCISETLNYATDLNESNFCTTDDAADDITYGISPTECEILYENAPEDCNVVSDCNNGYTVDSKTIVRTAGGSIFIEDVAQNSDFYKNNCLSVDNVTTLILDQPNKKSKKLKTQKSSKFSRNQENIQGLLKEEVRKTLKIINRCLDDEEDELKLKQILKQAKRLQKYVKGEEVNHFRGKKTGIQGMVNFNSVCDTSWLNT